MPHTRLAELLSGDFRADPLAQYAEITSPALVRNAQGQLVRAIHQK